MRNDLIFQRGGYPQRYIVVHRLSGEQLGTVTAGGGAWLARAPNGMPYPARSTRYAAASLLPLTRAAAQVIKAHRTKA